MYVYTRRRFLVSQTHMYYYTCIPVTFDPLPRGFVRLPVIFFEGLNVIRGDEPAPRVRYSAAANII